MHTMMAMPRALLVADIVLLLCALVISARRARCKVNKLPLPPGPKPWPIIGNVWDFPKTHEGRFYIDYKKIYGPISTLTSLNATYIVLNDLKVATELLERRSINTSDRYISTFSLMVRADLTTTFRKWGPELKYHRKLIQSYVNTRNAMTHIEEVEEIEARRLLLRLLNKPESFFQHFRTYTGSIILKLSHGYTVAEEGFDSLVSLAEEAIDVIINEVSMAGMFIDNFPVLRFLPHWFPGMSFKKISGQWKASLYDFYEKPFAFVKRKRSEGTAKPSFTSYFLDRGIEGDRSKEESLKYSAATMFAGGADTSPSALKTVIRALSLYPDVLRHAQDELDLVVGNDRLPNFLDREQLPYIDAILKEALRWETVLPTGVSHVSTEEEVYNGYRIPKGSVLIPNAWGMGHDPDYYANPSTFDPERFLNENPEPDPYAFAFGFGRRVCPGKRLADSTLFIAIAMIISTFNISKEKDENGSDIEPDCVYLPGIVSHPTPFQCSITPRSAKAIELIRSVIDEHPFQKGDSADLDGL